MVEKFVNPNCHVVLIHYPLGLLTVGIVIELLNLLWPRDRFRSAGRWMIVLGGLSSVIALTAGIYAYRDVVATLPTNSDYHWHTLMAHNQWTGEQWSLLSSHLWYNAIATVLFLVTVAVAIGSSDEMRRKWYWPLLALMLIGLALMLIGAWHGGEMVYRHGTGVLPPSSPGGSVPAVNPQTQPQPTKLSGLEYYIQPLQLHLILAGATFALITIALAVTFRRWNAMMLLPAPPGSKTPASPLTTEPIMEHPPGEVAVREAPHHYPGRYWVAALVVALATALVGIWSVMETFTAEKFQSNLDMLRESGHLRLLIHVIVGNLLILSSIVLAIFVRFAPQCYKVIKTFLVIALITAALQVWLGSMMLFDSHEGPLFSFTSADQVGTPSQVVEPHEHDHDHEHDLTTQPES